MSKGGAPQASKAAGKGSNESKTVPPAKDEKSAAIKADERVAKDEKGGKGAKAEESGHGTKRAAAAGSSNGEKPAKRRQT